MKKVFVFLVFSLLFSLTSAVYSIDQEQTDNAGITLNLSDGWHVEQEFQMGHSVSQLVDEIKKVELWVSADFPTGSGNIQGIVSVKELEVQKCFGVFNVPSCETSLPPYSDGLCSHPNENMAYCRANLNLSRDNE
ncbi:MAG: hypothetical protein ABIH23_19900 [bacterium]